MRLYNAGVLINMPKDGRLVSLLEGREREMRFENPWYLESYHYIHKPRAEALVRNEGVKILLDSGAFSAYTLGATIDIGEYCDYIHRNADFIEHASVLDAIGDYVGTWRNQAEMERRGVRPLPCFHYGEPEEVLDYYVANYDYITIGGMVPISTKQLTIWLDRIWAEHLTHADGRPKVKVHGFGLTSLPLMFRYPWYSVDSSTWVQWGSNGMILLPDERGRQLDISARSSRVKYAGMHLDNYAPPQREALEAKIRDFGVEPDRLRHVYNVRWSWNIWAFPKFASRKQWEGDRFSTIEQRLF
jgi:hypothetical protein